MLLLLCVSASSRSCSPPPIRRASRTSLATWCVLPSSSPSAWQWCYLQLSPWSLFLRSLLPLATSGWLGMSIAFRCLAPPWQPEPNSNSQLHFDYDFAVVHLLLQRRKRASSGGSCHVHAGSSGVRHLPHSAVLQRRRQPEVRFSAEWFHGTELQPQLPSDHRIDTHR